MRWTIRFLGWLWESLWCQLFHQGRWEIDQPGPHSAEPDYWCPTCQRLWLGDS